MFEVIWKLRYELLAVFWVALLVIGTWLRFKAWVPERAR